MLKFREKQQVSPFFFDETICNIKLISKFDRLKKILL